MPAIQQRRIFTVGVQTGYGNQGVVGVQTGLDVAVGAVCFALHHAKHLQCSLSFIAALTGTHEAVE